MSIMTPSPSKGSSETFVFCLKVPVARGLLLIALLVGFPILKKQTQQPAIPFPLCRRRF